MVSKADIQQVLFSVVFMVSLVLLTLTGPYKRYESLLEYIPWIIPYTGIPTRIALALLVFVSMVAIIIIQEFKKQDRPL